MSKFFKEIMDGYGTNNVIKKNPITMGYTETGNEVIFDMNQMGHTLISGMSRSGKSRMAKSLMKTILNFAEVAIFSPKPADYVEFMAKSMVSGDIDEFGTLVRRIVGVLERRNHSQLEKSMEAMKSVRCEDPPILIVIDEFATFSEMADEGTIRSLKRLISEGAGLNIFLMIITQVPTKKILSDGLRDNMMTLIAFKARDGYASRMAIGDRTAEFLELGQSIVKNVDKRYVITKYAGEENS